MNRQEEKYFAVQYGGYFKIQEGKFYGDNDILDAEDVGEKQAEENAKRIVDLLNGVSKEISEKEEGIKVSKSVIKTYRDKVAEREQEIERLKGLINKLWWDNEYHPHQNIKANEMMFEQFKKDNQL